jgi:RNA polymerase sigma factor (sigma-70 family)
LDVVLRHVRKLAGGRPGGEDALLVERFVGRRDGEAFAALVARHGPMILGVCRRVLGDGPDAEDAFQATFLVLVRKARSLTRAESLASWLYGVALRVSRRARDGAATRRRCERSAPIREAPGNGEEAVRHDLRLVIDEELFRLPEKYRAPLVLCYLEGKSYDEAARQLGWPRGTVCGRLSRARDLLRGRLGRRGLGPAAGGLAVALAGATAEAAPPAPLLSGTLRAAVSVAAGTEPAAGGASPRALALAEGAVRAMLLNRVKLGAVLLLLGLLAAGAGLAAHRLLAAPHPEARRTPGVSAPEGGEAVRADGPAVRVDDQGDPLPAGALARFGTTRFRLTREVGQIAFAPAAAGQPLALVAGGLDGKVVLWDAATGRELRRWEDLLTCRAVAVSPDGKRIAAGAWQTVSVRDRETGEELLRLDTGRNNVAALAYSPDGTLLASVGVGNEVRLWDARTGNQRCVWPADQGTQAPLSTVSLWSAVAFSPDSRTLALTRTSTREVLLCATATGEEVRRLGGPAEQAPGPISAVAFAPDGKLLVTAARGTLRFWDPGTGEEVRHAPHEGPARCLTFSPDGKVLAAGGARVRLYDRAGQELRTMEWDGTETVDCLAFSPDGATLAASRPEARSVCFWDVASGKLRPGPAGPEWPVRAVAFSPDGKVLASASWDCALAHHAAAARRARAVDRPAAEAAVGDPPRGGIRLWREGVEIARLGQGLGWVHQVAFLPDGRTLAALGEDGTVRFWEPATGKEVRRLPGPGRVLLAASLAGDGNTLAAVESDGGANADQCVSFWDVTTGERLRGFAADPGRKYVGVALSPDGRAFATLDRDGAVAFRDARTGEERCRAETVCPYLYVLAFAPDGRSLATAGSDGRVWVHDAATGKKRHCLEGHTGELRCLAFSPDGRTLATGGYGGVVHLWDTAGGEELARFTGHTSIVWAAAFAPDGRTLATGGEDTTILVWDVTGPARPR